jgi:hypothetical protein
MKTSNLILHPLICINKVVLKFGFQAFFPNVSDIPVNNFYALFAHTA